MAKEEQVYYDTALLWFKLTDVKAKEGDLALTGDDIHHIHFTVSSLRGNTVYVKCACAQTIQERKDLLNFANYDLLKKCERMQKNITTLHKENRVLKKEKFKLMEENHKLNIYLLHATGHLVIEKTFTTRLQARINFFYIILVNNCN